MKELKFELEPVFLSQRIDKALSERMDGHTRSAIQRLLDDGLVSVDGRTVSKNYKIKPSDRLISVTLPEPKALDLPAQDRKLNILYEDDCLLVVNKPKGMVVHPAPGNEDGTLVNALLYHCRDSLSGIGGVLRPGIVHRIDKDTSGLLMVAKNDQAHLSLAGQIKEHSFTRRYHAVVYGNIKEDAGTLNYPIGRHPVDRKRMAVTQKNAREAVTHFRVLERLGGFTYLELTLETGRTHQIRVHLAHIGHPVAGDPVYGPKKCIRELEGQCLHAKMVGFVHPVSGEYLEFDSELPDYFQNFLDKLRRMQNS
ncbi:RluA family pseudouridine synthase [Candidatus Soleaferrea massiliensis]|uniref:RluA family pseudouridine synthase n=1 Tax=Candidatus Soleaferrea massiliensis TaxID=1470354 RepID=UPI00058CAD4B|nr:RluA family pseudouridine synthase [Candidatus Soleaferrea massiliensis]